MAVLEIKKYPSSILRKVCDPVKNLSRREEEIFEDMVETMYLNHGVGLAASQVGLNMRLAVVDISGGLIKLANPKILKKEDRDVVEEGCLSVPGTCVKVKRAKKILVEFMDQSGKSATLEAQGLLARAVQHEIDHLNGRLIIDYVNPIKRLLFFLTRLFNPRG